MNDLISRQEAIDAVRHAWAKGLEPTQYLEELPSAQKTGTWTKKTVSSEGVEEWQAAQCSECGLWHTTPYSYYYEHYQFCPNCGARMESE